MHVHILGIGGTFMAGVALLARAAGHRVTGSDAALYPPMSTQLAAAAIDVWPGFEPSHLAPAPDVVVVGNALSRGNPAVEAVLDRGLAYTSGPQWLADHVLAGRWVLAVAGTHGKTTTASMLAHILVEAGLAPGYLIGGIAADLGRSAALGGGRYFVVEADEYDTAFFDKRSKFVHYRPRTCVLNNLEFDHADIFDDLEAIRRQFHQLVRTVPGSGRLVVNAADGELDDVLARGAWTPVTRCNADRGWRGCVDPRDPARLRLVFAGREIAAVEWRQRGAHNAENAAAALAAAAHVGVEPSTAAAALAGFRGVKRRLEPRATFGDIRVFDDFAHHPTAIRASLAAARALAGDRRVLAVLHPASNSMRAGVHGAALATSLAAADAVFVYAANLAWSPEDTLGEHADALTVADSAAELARAVAAAAQPGDHVVVMSNADFEAFFAALAERLLQHPACALPPARL